MFIHWGLYALPARHEWIRNIERIPNEDYEIYFEMFDPDLFDPKAWARAAQLGTFLGPGGWRPPARLAPPQAVSGAFFPRRR